MFASRILSRVSRSAGLRSSLSAAGAALPARSQTPILSRRYHSIVHEFSQKLAAAQVPLDSFPLQRFSFSSSTTPESNEKESNTEASSKTTGEKATADANESGLESEPSKDSRRGKGAKRGAVSDSDSGSDDEEELSRDELMKLVAEKEELLSEKEEEIKQMKDKVLRTYAEMENVMDRTRRDAENTKKYAIQNFAKSLLDVADNLGRASSVVKESFSKLDTTKEDSAGATPLLKTLLEGVEMTEKQLAESGYTLFDRVIRPAEVGVTQGGESEEDKKESDA
uniref:GrpE protein homolog n=1 Tax=Brassica campestris TaxID=3711 RepID=M4EC94_BRACM